MIACSVSLRGATLTHCNHVTERYATSLIWYLMRRTSLHLGCMLYNKSALYIHDHVPSVALHLTCSKQAHACPPFLGSVRS